MKWSTDNEFTLILLALSSAPSFTVDAQRIQKARPKGGEIPTTRAITDRFSLIKKRIPGVNLGMSGGGAPAKNKNIVPLATPAKATHGLGPMTPASQAPSKTTPFVVSKFEQSLNATGGQSNSVKKRKRSALSDDEALESMSEEITTSEDETPTKKIRRSPSTRRSASAKARYCFDDIEGSSGEKDSAAQAIDTEDEWNKSDEEGKLQKGRKGNWREKLAKTRLKEEKDKDDR